MEVSARKVVDLTRWRSSGRRRDRRPSDPEEEQLAGALGAGDPGALAAIDARYGRFVAGFLREALPDRGVAEEVFQQVLVEVWKRGPQYDPDRASLLTWIMTIARSRAIDERRRRRPEPLEPEVAASRAEGPGGEEIDEAIERWRVAELLSRIPREEAEVLRLRFYEGLAQPEIAERAGMALGTVKTRMVSGLARLRALIAEEER